MINFRSIPKKDPSDSSAVAKYYGTAVSSGDATLRSIAEKISARCTLTTMDTMAVLEGFINLIPEELAEGRIVKLGEFGSFRLSLKSEGVDAPEKFTRSNITETKVIFRQGTEFRNKMQNLQFSKIAG